MEHEEKKITEVETRIAVLQAEERNLTLVLRQIQSEIQEATSFKKMVIDSTKDIEENKLKLSEELTHISSKLSEIKLEVSNENESLQKLIDTKNQIEIDIISEKKKLNEEREQLQKEKESHYEAKAQFAKEILVHEARVKRITDAIR